MPADDRFAGSEPDRRWVRPEPPAPEEAAAYEDMIGTLRRFLDRLAGARPDRAGVAALTDALQSWSERLAADQVDEHDQLFGRLMSVHGRGQAAAPRLVIDEGPPGELRGRVVFGRYFLGVNGAVHGGFIPLLFDEVLGRAANSPGQRMRTAYLNVHFRALTPIDTPLEVRGWIDRRDGRKCFLRGDLRHGETVCAEAEGLFIALRPGQP